MRKRVTLIVLGALAVVAAGCGSDGGETATTDDATGTSVGEATTTDSRGVTSTSSLGGDVDDLFDLGVECVDEEVVSGVTGVAVVDVSINSGGRGGTGGLNLAWSGCTYDAEDGSHVTVSRLLDEDGEPSAQAFDQFAPLAGTEVEAVDVGSAAVFDAAGVLAVRTDAETFVFEVDGASLEPEDRVLLAEVARAVVEHDDPELLARCEVMRSSVPSEWGDVGDVLAGGGGDGDIEFDSCRVSISAVEGADLTLKIAESTDWYDLLAAGDDDAPPMAVDGIGDGAYAFGGRLYVLAGDQAFVVSGEDPDGNDAEPADLGALAEAVIAAS